MHGFSCSCDCPQRDARDIISGPIPTWQQPPVLRVRFSDPEEFAAELRERGPDVEHLVRITNRWRRDTDGLPCRHLSVVAGYLRSARNGLPVLYELVYYAGEVWDGLNAEVTARTRERAERARQIVVRAAGEDGLTAAPGAYRTPDERDPRSTPDTHSARRTRQAAA